MRTPKAGSGKAPRKPAAEPGTAPPSASQTEPAPQATPQHGPPQRGAGRAAKRWTARETQEQMDLVEQFHVGMLRPRQMLKAMAKAGHTIGINRLHVLLARVKQKWQDESIADRTSFKHHQVRRLEGYLVRARGRSATIAKDPCAMCKGSGMHSNGKDRCIACDGKRIVERVVEPAEKFNHQAVLGYENLLADLLGTREPLQVSVDVHEREAVRAVILEMTPDAIASALQEWDDLQYLATKAKELGFAPPPKLPELPAKAEVVEGDHAAE